MEQRWWWLVLPTAFVTTLIPFDHAPGYVHMSSWLAAASVLPCGLSLAFGGRFVLPKEVILYWLFVAWSTLGFFIAADPTAFLAVYRTCLQFCVLVAVMAYYGRNERHALRLLVALMCGGLFSGVWALAAGGFDVSSVTSAQVVGLEANRNAFALGLVTTAMVALFIGHTSPRRSVRAVAHVAVVLSVGLIMVTGSRQALVTITLFAAVWIATTMRAKGSRAHGRLLLGGVSIALLVVAIVGTGRVSDRMVSRITEAYRSVGWSGKRTSVTLRLDIYRQGLRTVLANPVAGIGLDQFRITEWRGKYGHSNVLEVAVSTGLVGLGVYYGIYGTLWRRLGQLRVSLGSRHGGQLASFGQAVLVAQVTSDLFSGSYNDKRTWIVLAILIGWSHAKAAQRVTHPVGVADAARTALRLQRWSTP